MQDIGTRASGERTLSTGVEAAREGTPQNVSFEYSISNWREKTIGQTQVNFFEQGENAMNSEGAISGDNVYYCSEEDRKMAWVREKRIKLFMQMELNSCRNELGWLIRYHNCSVDNCPEEVYPPRPLPIPPDYVDNLQSRLGKTMKGILSPTFEIILKTYYPLPARQGPLHPQQQKIPSCSLSPMPCTKPDSLRDNQTKSSSFGAQADGRKEEQIETSLEVQPDDMTGKHRDSEHNPLEQPQVSGDEDKVVAGGTSHAGQEEKIIFQTEVGMDLETSQIVARHFVKLAMFRQQGATSKSTDRGGNYPL